MTIHKRTNDKRDDLEKKINGSGGADKQNASNPAHDGRKVKNSEDAARKKRDAQTLSIDPKTVSAERKKMPDNRSEGQGKKDEPRT